MLMTNSEIYGQTKKNSKPFSRIDISPLDGSEVRKTLSQCFSTRSLKESEVVVQGNLDAFISRLSAQGGAVNIKQVSTACQCLDLRLD